MARIFAQNVNKLPLTVGTDNDAVEKLLLPMPVPPSMNACASRAHTNNTIAIHPAYVQMLRGEYFEFILLSLFGCALCGPMTRPNAFSAMMIYLEREIYSFERE